MTGLCREANNGRVDQAGFWQGPARPIIERFARNVLAHGSQNLMARDIQNLQKLVQQTPLPVLAVDLGKIRKLNTYPKERPNVVTLPAPTNKRAAQIMHSCILCNGGMMFWYDNDRLELRNVVGEILWARQLSNVTALIPMGASPTVMVLQSHDEFETRLTKFETHKRKLTDIGILHLVAWHDAMSDGQWLVQVNNVIGAIDLVKLSQKEPELEFLWSVETTNEMKVMAFLHTGGSAFWLTRNVSKVRFGVMQAWEHSPSGGLDAKVCLPGAGMDETLLQPHIEWLWSAYNNSNMIRLRIVGNTHRDAMRFCEVDYSNKKEAIAFAQQRVGLGYTGSDTVQSCDFNRQSIALSSANTLISKPKVIDKNKEHFTVHCEGDVAFRVLARGTHPGALGLERSVGDISHIALCSDNYGRIIRIDHDAHRAEVFNSEVTRAAGRLG